MTRPRVAIAHDYLTQRGGAERVVLALKKAFPDAPIHTMLYDAEHTFPAFRDMDIRVPPINRVRWARAHHRSLAPVLPWVADRVKIDADVVVASSSGWAHGFRTTGAMVVYCHTPARWIYQTDHFFGERPNRALQRAARAAQPYLRRWDQRAAGRVTTYVANSTEVQRRILETYQLPSELVHAPTLAFLGAITEPVPDQGDYFLVVARLLPYKNVDAVVRAFSGRSDKLLVIGVGPELENLKRLATANVSFRSGLTDQEMLEAYRHAKAVVAASYEDFGLVPIEAAVVGRPAITLRAGGFLDTVREGTTGLFFDRPEPKLIAEQLDEFERRSWDQTAIRTWVEQFSEDRFIASMTRLVDEQLRDDHPHTLDSVEAVVPVVPVPDVPTAGRTLS